jgi:hydroxymethylbilane synthase
MVFMRIGTRGSPLALAQAHLTRASLCAAHKLAPEAIEIVILQTSGDIIQDRPLSEVGGKGLFAKEIETALLAGQIDIAVHSGKDMATVLPAGLTIFAALPREDVRDVYLSRDGTAFKDTPQGAVIGTASLRRAAQVQMLRPDIETINFRGNVQTRLRKLSEGKVAGTLLALAGLKRLGLDVSAYEILSPQDFLPAVAQGIIVIEGREEDARMQALLDPLHCATTEKALYTERAFLRMLDGSCRTPLAGLAHVREDKISFTGEAYHAQQRYQITLEGDDPETLGQKAGLALRAMLPENFFT